MKKGRVLGAYIINDIEMLLDNYNNDTKIKAGSTRKYSLPKKRPNSQF